MSLTLLHTSDWHLGRTLHGEDLHDAHAAYIDHLEQVVRDNDVDALLIAGDVYDRGVPSVVSVAMLDDALVRLSALTRVILTPGNHDSAIRLGFSARLLDERVVVRASVAGISEPIEVYDADGSLGALVYALPYLDPDLTRAELGATARSHQAVLDAAMGRVREDLVERRAAGVAVPAVVMAHAFVTGGEASDSERDIRVGGVDSVAAATFQGVEYVALGHLHGPQRISSGVEDAAAVEEAESGKRTTTGEKAGLRKDAAKGAEANEKAGCGKVAGRGSGPKEVAGRGGAPIVRYSGSPLAFSFSEARHKKSSVLVRLDGTGVASTELIPAPVPRALADLRGTMDELASPEFDAHRDKYVRVAVTDARRPDHLWERLRELFPHVLAHSHEPPEREATPGRAGVSAQRATTDPLAVLAEFVEAAGGDDPTDAELAVLREVYESVLAANRSA